LLLVRLVRESSVPASSAQWFIAALRVALFSLEGDAQREITRSPLRRLLTRVAGRHE